MIVVVGTPAWRAVDPQGLAGRTCGIALAAAAAGARVEVVGRIGDDPAGDALVIALSGAGVGHAAALRDPARATVVVAAAPREPSAGAAADALDAFDPFADGVTDVEPAPDPLPPGAPRLQRADVALSLSYLTAFSILVVADDAPPDVVPACAEGAAFAGAQLVVLVPEGAPVPPALPATATVLAAPAGDDVGAFARVVGRYAAGLDTGVEPAAAFRAATAADGWDPAGGAAPA